MARPRLTEEEKRSQQLFLRLTPAEKALLDAAAREAQRTTADFVRLLALNTVSGKKS